MTPDRARDWIPDTIKWQEIGSDGTRYALLEGRRDRAGEAFSYAFFIPGGFWDAPPLAHGRRPRVRGQRLLTPGLREKLRSRCNSQLRPGELHSGSG